MLGGIFFSILNTKKGRGEPLGLSNYINKSLLNHPQILTNFGKGFNRFVKVVAFVGRRYLYAYACLSFGYYGVEETDNINTFSGSLIFCAVVYLSFSF
jgi:hypothetical protein